VEGLVSLLPVEAVNFIRAGLEHTEQILSIRTTKNACACRKLHPAILMVKPAQDGQSSELAEPLRLSTARRILHQGKMRSDFVVVTGVAARTRRR
jgi:hypothetical protein